MVAKITWINETRRLGELIPWPRNPRQITRDQAKRLRDSFEAFGQVETIAVGPDNNVYNGHQRLNVLMEQHSADIKAINETIVSLKQSNRILTWLGGLLGSTLILWLAGQLLGLIQ